MNNEVNKSTTRFLFCGAAFSGNLGAEAMYDSIADELKKINPDIDISILSKYPKDDSPGCTARGYTLIPFSTLYQLLAGGIFFVLGGLCKLLHLPHKWLAFGALRTYYENDILIDASGIAFSDDRPLSSLLINTLWFLPGIISGIPMVKVSQSLGPYKKPHVRFVAKWILSKIPVVVCRGNVSYGCTTKLLPKKQFYNLPDCAICLQPANEERTTELLEKLGVKKQQYIVVGPSFVMQQLVGTERYMNILHNCVSSLRKETGLPVLLLSHSAMHSRQLGVDAAHDDLMVCQLLAETFSENPPTVADFPMSARELKAVIGSSTMAVGSRFHFLVAALSSGVPSMALGWSHKYHELFGEFGLEQYVLVYNNMESGEVCNLALELASNRESVANQLATTLPRVRQRSQKNAALVFDLLERQ